MAAGSAPRFSFRRCGETKYRPGFFRAAFVDFFRSGHQRPGFFLFQLGAVLAVEPGVYFGMDQHGRLLSGETLRLLYLSAVSRPDFNLFQLKLKVFS